MIMLRTHINNPDADAPGGWVTQILKRQDIQMPTLEADEAGIAQTRVRWLGKQKSDRSIPQGTRIVDIIGNGLGTPQFVAERYIHDGQFVVACGEMFLYLALQDGRQGDLAQPDMSIWIVDHF